MTLTRRLARLEAVRPVGGHCTCPFSWEAFRATFDDQTRETCERCGRPLELVIRYVDGYAGPGVDDMDD